MSRIGQAVRSMKWYEWFILVESVAFLLIIQFSAKYPSTAGFWGGAVFLLLIGFVNSFLPARFARKSREQGGEGLSRFMIVVTCLGLGLLGLLAYGISRLPSVPSGSGSYAGASAYKKCGRCGRPAPYSAKAGDTCQFCGARWDYENTIRM